ncbi:MAG: SDR family oxidoreductase [Chitinophagaceae bacterium]
MKILITGANGFVGHYLVKELIATGHYVIATGKSANRLPFTQRNFIYEQMDFTDPFNVHDIFEKHQPEFVIHAGAMGKPDEVEAQQWQAYLVNVEGTVTLLTNAEEYQSFFVYVSTDFVFSGGEGEYTEEDMPGPVNYYGKTKLDAEEAVKEYTHDWSIVRTVLVYGQPASGRSNILTIVKDKLEKGESYNVVDDQWRTPTYVEDLARGISLIIDKRAKGIFHIAGKDKLTPFRMAKETAVYLGLNDDLIKRVTAADFTQPAARPANTTFVIDKAKAELGYEPGSFLEGLQKMFPR